jgi:hypothetical protein
MSDIPHIFPTLDRPKHSKLLAYPIGAEALSRGLDGVPQHALLACEFFASNPNHEQNKRNLLYFMAVSYARRERSRFDGPSAAERGVFDPRWKINIHAVPIEVRAHIKKLLIENAMETILRPWLVANAMLTGKTGGAALILHYDRDKNEITHQEREGIAPERST